MSQPIDNPYRTIKGGLIDRYNRFDFSFNGVLMQGYLGDTLASALLANGVRLVGRSFKYHRPRGIMSAGSEEPNALVTIGRGGRQEPNTRATMLELYDGLEAFSQNHWPSLGFDVMGLNDHFQRFIPAGFYYKTFMGPHKSWWYDLYEPLIRRAAGLGQATSLRDPDHYAKMHGHCDVLIIGAGPAGLSAARALGKEGKQVILVDENPTIGGQLLWNGDSIEARPAIEWADQIDHDLALMDNVRVLTRTTVFGAYDGLTFGAVERVCDHMLAPVENLPRQRFWFIRAKAVIYATGAIERPMVMDGNDRPGVMMAGAALRYLNQYAVVPGQRVAITTNNDSAYAVAADLAANGVEVVGVYDVRPQAGLKVSSQVNIHPNSCIKAVHGGNKITGFDVATLADGSLKDIRRGEKVDAILMSGGWTPNVHLMCHKGDKPVWNHDLVAMVPGVLPDNEYAIGSVVGAGTTAQCIIQALEAAGKILGKSLKVTENSESRFDWNVQAFWKVPGCKNGFVEFQNDATAKDINLSVQEGYKSVEHMKRYTTLGMATDQGKMANLNGLALLAQARGEAIPDVGTTTYRPPFTPFAIGTLAGHRNGKRFVPTRYTATHRWAEGAGAVMTDAGMWKRAQWFHQEGDASWIMSCNREVLNTRQNVGINDVSTLGKIDIQGPDSGEFLNRLYTNGFGRLPVGRARYGLMLREDGSVMDDGTTSRIGEHHYYMTTTTAAAATVLAHMEYYHQAIWPGLQVQFTSVTDQWSAFAVAGPKSRDVLTKIVENLDISNQAFPFMAVADCHVLGGMRARLFRISFSGELAYEIAVDARYGQQLWDALIDAGQEHGIAPYGLEALNVMRIEKGHVTHAELDGRVSIEDTGLGKMQSTQKDYIGRVATTRPAYKDLKNREQLVGLRPVGTPRYGLNKSGEIAGPRLRAGSLVYPISGDMTWEEMQGWVSSVCYSPVLESMIGLAFVKNGHARLGEKVRLYSHLHEQRKEPHAVEVELVDAHFVDPNNEKLMA